MRRKNITRARRGELLKQAPVFSGLEDVQATGLAAAAALHEYESGELLFRNNEKAEGFFVICSGEVEVFRAGAGGREQILHIIEAGELCGEVPVFHGGRFPASARARCAVQALYLPSAEFFELALEQPQILLEMLAMLCMRMRHFASLISDLSLKDVTARLAGYIIGKTPAGAGGFSLDCPKSELAARLGTIPETLSRSLNRLKSAGAITLSGDRIKVTDAGKLESLAHGEKA